MFGRVGPRRSRYARTRSPPAGAAAVGSEPDRLGLLAVLASSSSSDGAPHTALHHVGLLLKPDLAAFTKRFDSRICCFRVLRAVDKIVRLRMFPLKGKHAAVKLRVHRSSEKWQILCEAPVWMSSWLPKTGNSQNASLCNRTFNHRYGRPRMLQAHPWQTPRTPKAGFGWEQQRWLKVWAVPTEPSKRKRPDRTNPILQRVFDTNQNRTKPRPFDSCYVRIGKNTD